MVQAGQPPLRVSPRLGAQRAQNFPLRLGPHGPRLRQGPSAPRGEPHRLDPPVGVRRPLDHAAALQEAKAARQRRLVNGEFVLQLLQTRLAQACDRRKNTELGHPETARPQAIVVELRHHAGDHAERVADTGRQASPVLSSRQPGDLSTHGRHPISDTRARQAITCTYIVFLRLPTRRANPAGSDRRPRRKEKRRMSPSPSRNRGVAESINLTEKNLDKVLVATEVLVIIDLWAEWCGPCRAIAPVLEELAEASEGRVTLMKVNVDENHGLAARYGLQSIPTILFFKAGAVVDRVVGAAPKAVLQDIVKRRA